MRALFSSTCLAGGLAAVGLTAWAATAQAQTTPAAATPSSTTVGEIVVTANKRTENVQNVPSSVQVVTPAVLAVNGVREFTDLTKVAPSLVVRPAEQPLNADVSIRGIGTFAYSIGVEPSVAVVIDDVPVAFQPRAFADVSDIKRIEVLSGPQSTLYGKSASAGLINIVTNDPTPVLSGQVHALATGDGEYAVGGAIAGPITDTLRFRLTANYDDFGGNVKNLYNGDEAGGYRTGSTYGKLVWQPTQEFTATLAANYIDGDTTVGRPFVALGPNAYLRGNPAQPSTVWAPGVTPGPDNTNFSNNYNAGTNYWGFGQSLKLAYDLGWGTLISVTSHDQFASHDRLDQDDTSVATPDNRQIGVSDSTQWTQEVRLVSPGNQPLRYTVGFFFADLDFSRDFVRGPYFSQANWDATSGSVQEAGFGQVDWEFIPGTTATAGLRYNHEAVDYTFRDIQNGNAYFKGNTDDSDLTYRLALEHKFTRNIMVYGSFATGHKGPAYDLSTGFNLNRELAGPIHPETSGSYEVGARTQFFDRRLTLNVTAFDALYRNFQAQGIEVLPDGTTNYRLANVGKLRTRGVEVNSTARVWDRLNLGLSATYLDEIIASYPDAQCYTGQTAAQGCTGSPAAQNLSGKPGPQAPKWKLSANLDYSRQLGASPFEGVFQAAYSYMSSFNYSLSQDPTTIQRAYGILNLSAGVRNPEKHYEIMVFVNNVFNEHYYVDMYDSNGTYNNARATQALLPRDFDEYAGVRASYSF